MDRLDPLDLRKILRFKMPDRHRKALRRGEYNQESVDESPLVDAEDDQAVQAEQKEGGRN